VSSRTGAGPATYIVVHLVQAKRSNVEVCQFLFFRDADVDLVRGRVAVAFVFVFRRGPVLHAHHLGEVERLREHHDAADVLLPHHAPEVEHGVFGGSLCDDVSVRLKQTLKARITVSVRALTTSGRIITST
jgi:hypothetical protein